MFGIAWGVGSMLLLISVGEGFRSGNHRQLASIGNDVIMMWGGTIPAVPSQHTGMRPYNLTLEDEAAMRASGSFRQVMAMVNRSDLKQQSQYESAGGSVIGTEPNYPVCDRFLPWRRDASSMTVTCRTAAGWSCWARRARSCCFRGGRRWANLCSLNGTSFQVVGVAEKTGHGNNDSDQPDKFISR